MFVQHAVRQMSLLKRKVTLPRLIAICVLLGLTGWLQPRVAEAGCHYGHAAQGSADFDHINRDGHVRDFPVLGQWVYEGGRIKYFPWQRERKCSGPNCNANNDRLPVSGATSTVDSNRSHTTLMYCDDRGAKPNPSLCLAFSLQNVAGFRGYPHALEYPP